MSRGLERVCAGEGQGLNQLPSKSVTTLETDEDVLVSKYISFLTVGGFVNSWTRTVRGGIRVQKRASVPDSMFTEPKSGSILHSRNAGT